MFSLCACVERKGDHLGGCITYFLTVVVFLFLKTAWAALSYCVFIIQSKFHTNHFCLK